MDFYRLDNHRVQYITSLMSDSSEIVETCLIDEYQLDSKIYLKCYDRGNSFHTTIIEGDTLTDLGNGMIQKFYREN